MKDLTIHRRATVVVDAVLKDKKVESTAHEKMAREDVDSFTRIMVDRMVEFAKEWATTTNQIKTNVEAKIVNVKTRRAPEDASVKVTCPYCGCDALIRLVTPPNPELVHFSNENIYGDLNNVTWQAYACGVCKQVVIIDEEAANNM